MSVSQCSHCTICCNTSCDVKKLFLLFQSETHFRCCFILNYLLHRGFTFKSPRCWRDWTFTWNRLVKISCELIIVFVILSIIIEIFRLSPCNIVIRAATLEILKYLFLAWLKDERQLILYYQVIKRTVFIFKWNYIVWRTIHRRYLIRFSVLNIVL